MRLFILNFGPNKELVLTFMSDIDVYSYENKLKGEVKGILDSYDFSDLSLINDLEIEKKIVDLFHSKKYLCAFMDNVFFIEA